MVGGPQKPSGHGSKEHDKQNNFIKIEINPILLNVCKITNVAE
jgi:hypothetical protein